MLSKAKIQDWTFKVNLLQQQKNIWIIHRSYKEFAVRLTDIYMLHCAPLRWRNQWLKLKNESAWRPKKSAQSRWKNLKRNFPPSLLLWSLVSPRGKFISLSLLQAENTFRTSPLHRHLGIFQKREGKKEVPFILFFFLLPAPWPGPWVDNLLVNDEDGSGLTFTISSFLHSRVQNGSVLKDRRKASSSVPMRRQIYHHY